MFRRRTNVYSHKIPKYTMNGQEKKKIYNKLALEKLKTEMEILTNRREHFRNSVDTIDKEIKQFLHNKSITEIL